MIDSDTKLRHLPFFDELAGLEPDDAAWRTASAGLVTLRLVEAWLEDDAGVSPEDWGVRHVLKAIEDIGEGTTVRSLLARVVESMRSARPTIHDVVAPLMAYAQALEYDAKWLLAGDVYQTLLARLHPVEDADASISAHIRLGVCLRNRHLLQDAATAYQAALRIATNVDDLEGVLRARIGEASLATLRGNLPAAESILDETIARAAGSGLGEVRSKALGDRSAVAVLGGRYELGIRFAYDALTSNLTSIDRDRVLNNIAAAFVHLGVYSAARDAYLVLSATAQEQYMRWTATLNLLDISSLTGAGIQFEQYQRQLSGVELPPHLATNLEVLLGKGHQRFGDLGRARLHLQLGIAKAQEHGLNQLLFDAEGALASLHAPAPPPRVSAEVPPEIEQVAQGLRGLRESAGVG